MSLGLGDLVFIESWVHGGQPSGGRVGLNPQYTYNSTRVFYLCRFYRNRLEGHSVNHQLTII